MSKVIVVFGATSGIGLDIALSLSGDNKVYAIGRDIDKVDMYQDKMTLISLDVTDFENAFKVLKTIETPDIVIFCAGCAYYGLHETISKDAIKQIIDTNLTSPMEITSFYLQYFKNRKSGRFIFISSITANHINTHACCYGASKAGLTSFATSLFDEVRKHNIKVNIISPDLTSTDLYRNADFMPDEDYSLKASDVTECVKYCISQPDNVDILEVKIRPQQNKILKTN